MKYFGELFCISRLLLWIKGILKRSNCGKVKKRILQWFGILEHRISLPNRIQFTGDKESMDSGFSCSKFSTGLAKSWDKSVLPLKRLCCHTVEKNIYSVWTTATNSTSAEFPSLPSIQFTLQKGLPENCKIKISWWYS